jgi:hypothetical protein
MKGNTNVGTERLVERKSVRHSQYLMPSSSIIRPRHRDQSDMFYDPLFLPQSDANDDNDLALNRRYHPSSPPNDIYSTLFKRKGQSIVDDIPMNEILANFKKYRYSYSISGRQVQKAPTRLK